MSDDVMVLHPSEVDQMSKVTPGDLLVIHKLSPLDGFVALGQKNLIHEVLFSSSILEVPHERIKVGIDTIFIHFFYPDLRIVISGHFRKDMSSHAHTLTHPQTRTKKFKSVINRMRK